MMFNLKRQTAHCSKVQPMADNDVLLLKRNTYDECWIIVYHQHYISQMNVYIIVMFLTLNHLI